MKSKVEYVQEVEENADDEKMTLWKINDEIERVLNLLGWADERGKAEFLEELESLSMQMEEKLENIGYHLMNSKEKIASLEAGIKKLTEWRDRIKGKSEWLNEYAVREMQRAGIKKIETEFMSISRRKKPVRTEVAKDEFGEIDYSEVAPEYVKSEIKLSVDKRAAIDYYKAIKAADEDAVVEVAGIEFIDDDESLIVK